MALYFLAVLPPKNIIKEIVSFQKEIETQFGAKHAQKVLPHITVIPPFEASEEKVEIFTEVLVAYFLEKPFSEIIINLDNFQKFESRTLFVDVARNEAFEQFCKEIKLLFNQQRIIKQRTEKHFFVPHITLANKDLKKRDFKIVWEDFKSREYQTEFELEALTLLKRKEDRWEIESKISIFKKM